MLLHPDEVSRRGVADGQLARVYNERGETKAHVLITDDVPPGVAVLPGLWWGRHTPSGVSANALTSQRLSDLGEWAEDELKFIVEILGAADGLADVLDHQFADEVAGQEELVGRLLLLHA